MGRTTDEVGLDLAADFFGAAFFLPIFFLF